MLDSVVLPAPFSPSSACTSPGAASKSTSSFATTAGNRFVIPRSATAGGGGEAYASPPELSALGATDHAFDEPVHRVEVLDRQPLSLLDPQLALLVVERSSELVELAGDQRCPLRLREIEPRVRPDQTHLRARMRRLRAERERVCMTDHLRDRVRHHIAEHAFLRGGAGRHAREVDRVFAGTEVLGEILRLRR